MRAMSLGGAARLLFGRIGTEDPRKRRVLAIVQSVVTSLGNRLLGMVISFLSVPLTIGYLGDGALWCVGRRSARCSPG